MIITLFFAALLGGVIGGAELVARYRDKPAVAVLSPSGLLYVFVNATASVVALVAMDSAGWRLGLPGSAPQVSVHVVQVMAAGLGAAALFRVSFTLVHDKGISVGPILVLHGMLKIVDASLERKRALSRLSHNDLARLSFHRDHAALTELCCHALQEFDLSVAQRLGELASDLRYRDDLTDADKLDCFGLELNRLVGERALRKAADRLRGRPHEEPAGELPHDERLIAVGAGRPAAGGPAAVPGEPLPGEPGGPAAGRLTRRPFGDQRPAQD